MSVDASDVWLARNRHWGTLTELERVAFTEGTIGAYRDVFCVFLEVVKAQGTLDDALKAVGDLYEVEHDRAVIAGIL